MSQLEEAVRNQDRESVVASRLAKLAQTPGVMAFAGDIKAAVEVMRTVVSRLQYLLQTQAESFYNKEYYVQEVVQNILRSAASLMQDEEKVGIWMTIPARQRSVLVTHLLQTMEENAFLLADVTEKPEILEEVATNISECNWT